MSRTSDLEAWYETTLKKISYFQGLAQSVVNSLYLIIIKKIDKSL